MKSIKELHEYIVRNQPEMAEHKKEEEGDLPSFSLERLEEESKLLHLGLSFDNVVPAYWGIGLISRCLWAVQQKEELKLEFFLSLGYEKLQAQKMVNHRWY